MTAIETHCSTDDNMGYGRLGKYIVEALNRRGIETTQEEGKCEALMVGLSPEPYPRLVRRTTALRHRYVRGHPPPRWAARNYP